MLSKRVKNLADAEYVKQMRSLGFSFFTKGDVTDEMRKTLTYNGIALKLLVHIIIKAIKEALS